MAVLAEKLLVQKFFSLDTETTGIDPITAELVGMSFSFAENQAFMYRYRLIVKKPLQL